MERFFFIVGIWVYVKRILEESRRCWPRLRGVDALIQETSRCRKCRCSCCAEFGQAFSTLKSKIIRCDACACRGGSVPLLNASRRSKASQISTAMRGRSAFKSNSHRRAGGARSTAYQVRRTVDQPDVQSTERTSRALSAHARHCSGRKAVGEADSFPYRLITNDLFTSATTYGRGGGVGRGRGDGV